MPPSMSTKTHVVPGSIQFVSSAGETLKSATEKPIANTKDADHREAAELLRGVFLALVGDREARGDGERAHADRERLAERDDAADDRQAQPAPAQRDAVDVVLDLGDAAVGAAHGDGPARRAAHHHALEHRLPTDRRHQAADN